jgi:hypothetical protein
MEVSGLNFSMSQIQEARCAHYDEAYIRFTIEKKI